MKLPEKKIDFRPKKILPAALILLLIILVFTLITDRYTDEGTSRGGALL